ncbi:MAG: TolC family protein [Bacteroidales bacterium]|jgi:outer membrane protein TolC|nr:TolC family protein [Bacteroidales bacterium]
MKVLKIIAISALYLTFNTLWGQGSLILTLEQCRELALKNNEKIKNAEISVEIARQQKKEAFTKFFPSVSGSGLGFMSDKPVMSMDMDMSAMMQPMMESLTPTMIWLMQQGAPLDVQALQSAMQPQKIEMPRNGMLASVSATQPLFAGGQIVTGNRLAKAGIEVRQLQKQMTENEVLLAAEQCFWQLVSLKEKMKTIENSDSLLSRILSDVKVAVSAGLTTRNDILRVELEQNKLQSGKLKAENGLKMLKMVLAHKIGLPADSFDIQQPVITEMPPVETHNHTSLQNRLEYKLLEKSTNIAKMQVNMEISKNLPTVAIGAGYNYMNFDMHKDKEMKNNYAMLFANVSIPITDWWAGSHAIKRKKLELQQVENTKRESSELLQQQMQNIQNELNETYSQALIAKKLISSAEENLKISKDNYNAGITTLSDLLEAQNILQQAQDGYTEAFTEYFMKLAQWRQLP